MTNKTLARWRKPLIRVIFGLGRFKPDFMTWHHQIVHVKAKTRAQSGDYVWLVVLRDVFLALGFLVVAFFAAVFFETVFFATVFFEAGFFNAAFCFFGLVLMAGCLDEFDLAAPFGGVVVINSYSDSETA